MHYAHIWRALGATPWAILPSKLSAIVELVARRERGEDLDPEEIRALVGAARQQQQPRSGSGIAVLPIMGTLVQRASMLEQASGATSCEQIGALFAQALADPAIGTILLNIDSPGGNVNGIPELAAQIADGARQKRVVAVANSLAASAAYWLASQAESLYVTPSGMVGSIGVIAAHEDISGLLDREGVKMSLITAGKFKGELNPFMPLSEEDRAATQQQVDYYYGLFTRAVAQGRGTTAGAVQAGMGQGRVVNASDAVKLGMADGIKTVDQVLAALANGRLARPDRHAAVAADWGPLEIAGPTLEPTATGDAGRSTGIVAAGASAVGFLAGAIAPHETATTDGPWDNAANKARLGNDDPEAWRRAFAWFDDAAPDPDGDGYPDRKGDYAFLHHMVGAGGQVGAANTEACSLGIATLNGGRIQPGDDTPWMKDREGIHRHLAKHLQDAGSEPPPLRGAMTSHADADLRRRRLRLHEALAR